MALIEARDLTIGYTKPLMEHLDFNVERGDVFLVLGGSGPASPRSSPPAHLACLRR